MNVTISINDLKEWHRWVIQDAKQQFESFIRNENDEKYLNTIEVCEMLGISSTTLWRWNKQKYLMPISLGGKNGYKLSEVKGLLNRKKAS